MEGPKTKWYKYTKATPKLHQRLQKSERDFIYITMESSIEIDGIPNHLVAITYF
jgi:hypothetical protein